MSDYPLLRLRVLLGPDVMLGPGKADLLQRIAETGSIAAAGRRMGMSYKRAWYLIDTMNAYFDEPVVISSKGGARGGGASLTDTGKAVLAYYRDVQHKAEAAAQGDLHKLAALAKRRIKTPADKDRE